MVNCLQTHIVRIFFKFEKATKASRQLLRLRSSDGHILDDNTEIVHFVRAYFEIVFSFQPHDMPAMRNIANNLSQIDKHQ